MKTSDAPLVPATAPAPEVTLREHLRAVLVRHTEEIVTEIAPTLRRLRTLFVVLAISVPVFFAGLVFAIWHLAH